MRSPDSFAFGPVSTTTATFNLIGGVYQFTATATNWNSGTVGLSQLGPDNATWLTTAAALTANGGGQLTLAPGQYQVTITGALGVWATVVRIPGE